MKKIIIINLILVLLFTLLLELFSAFPYLHHLAKVGSTANKDRTYVSCFLEELIAHYKHADYLNKHEFRKVNIGDNNKIILLGCSYAYGQWLNDNQTFSHYLSKITKHSVYNLGISGGGAREALYISENKDILKSLIGGDLNYTTVIYLYISDHKKRLYHNLNSMPPKYKIKNGQLTHQKSNIFDTSYIKRQFEEKITYKYACKENQFNLFIKYIKQIKENFIKLSENKEKTRFIVFVYTEYDNEDWKKLKDEGIEVIRVKDISTINIDQQKYICEIDDHPSELAWKELTPLFVKKANL